MVDPASEQVRFAPVDVELVAGGLLAAIDVDGGPTEEQRTVLGSVVRHVWRAPDLDVEAVRPLDPAAVATRLTDAAERLGFCELAMVLELCRHPQSAAQVDRVEQYAAALGIDGIALETTRTTLERGAAIVAEDLERNYHTVLPEISELQLRDRYLTLDAPDPALGDRLRTLGDLPPGTLGHAYVAFYRDHGFPLPGDDVHLPAHYVNHDMNHVLTDYEPNAAGEVARSGFIWAAHGSRANWMEFLLTLSIHESGVLNHGEIRAKVATLARPGVAELLGEGLERGQQCGVNLPSVDHLELAAEPLGTIRERFQIVPRTPITPTD